MTATAILDLERAGFTREQVEALARLLESQLATKADLANLATRTDLTNLATKAELANFATKAELAEVKFDLIKWVVGVGFVQALTLIGALLTFLKLFPGGRP